MDEVGQGRMKTGVNIEVKSKEAETEKKRTGLVEVSKWGETEF